MLQMAQYPSFLRMKNMSLVYIVHIFIHPSTGHFHTLAIVNNATTNMGVTDISLRLHFL